MIKNILFKLPEYYFIIIVFAAGYTPPFSISLLYIVLIAALGLQIYFANKVSGLLIGGLIFFFNIFFLVAVVSEFNDFIEFNSEAQQLLFVGLLIWLLNMVASVTMIYRYSKMKTRSSQRIKFY
ncbi:MAG: hypothetical protein ABF274_13200 [Nonlabens sp.]|jgi:hypothetical protein|uniref:hypothetical protein n=1 Tax=Nonlabens sp. TaxID=1888209 RepID=UPI0032192CED